MVFYLVGLGLGDAKDITVKGLEVVRGATRVYLEAYTSILTVGKEQLEKFYGREIILADRDMVEQSSETLLENADSEDVAFLVVGDPFGATTHTDLVLRAKQEGIPVSVVHNTSIMNAVGCCGLQLYNFGETVSICFWTDTWQPDSFYDKIAVNREREMHTLCLLDIKVKEQSIENMMRGRKVYEPARFMSVAQAAEQLVSIIKRKKGEEEGKETAFDGSTICVGLARVGSESQKIVAAPLEKLAETDMGEPLHCLIIPGKMHPLEVAMLRTFVSDEEVNTLLKAMEEDV